MTAALRRERVVAIVDDDASILAALDRLTRSLGYRPLLFESAQALLDAFDAAEPACVVTDVQMPGLSGLDLLAILSERRPGFPVIVVTAYPSGATRDRALALGAFAYLGKPFDADHYEQCLTAVLGSAAPS